MEHRVRILERLATAPASVGELADLLPISRPAVSQHLRVLHEQDLVTYHAAGTRNIYRLETAGLVALRDWLNDIWPTAFDRYVEYVGWKSLLLRALARSTTAFGTRGSVRRVHHRPASPGGGS